MSPEKTSQEKPCRIGIEHWRSGSKVKPLGRLPNGKTREFLIKALPR